MMLNTYVISNQHLPSCGQYQLHGGDAAKLNNTAVVTLVDLCFITMSILFRFDCLEVSIIIVQKPSLMMG